QADVHGRSGTKAFTPGPLAPTGAKEGMKKLLLSLVLTAALLAQPVLGGSQRGHSSHTRGQRVSSSASRPYYGGGHHTKSHGGKYQGSVNSHHKRGHYNNPRTDNRYGKHK